MNYVFGPVPSRRLGQSLGIDPVPLKTCNWNCIYCQLGRSKPMVNERRIYYPVESILDEVRKAVTSQQSGEIDWVTFVGSGETTLHASLGTLIRETRALTTMPVAVITNGSLLYLPEVRRELCEADAVLPSLDAGNAKLYRRINRPHPSLTFERLIDGMVSFRDEFAGKLWLEVMLMGGVNDTGESLTEIAEAVKRIRPDEVHILQPTRPPVETWVNLPDEEGLLRARAILGSTANVVHPASGTFELGQADSLVDAIVEIITRHPMREDELEAVLEQWSPGEVAASLSALSKSGRAQVVERYGVLFWSASLSHYPEQ